MVPVTPLNDDMSSPSEQASRSVRQGGSKRTARGSPAKQSPKVCCLGCFVALCCCRGQEE